MNRSVSLLLFLSFFGAACSPSKPDCARPDVFCVGFVTDAAGLQDYGLNQSAWLGIQRAQADGLIQYAAYIESNDSRDYAKNIVAFVQDGYDLIVTSGAGMRDDTLQAADLHPATVFMGLDQLPDPSRPNFTAMIFPEDYAGFLAGALAALMTKTSRISAVCETSGIDSVWRTCDGFRAGAYYVDKKVKTSVNFRDSGSRDDLFNDPTWGQDTALSMVRQGADVIFGVGGGTGEGALQAAAEEQVYAIGSEQDQFYVTRETDLFLITSILPDASQGIYNAIPAIKNGQHPPKITGQIGMAPYHDLDPRVPDDVKKKIQEIYIDLLQGRILTGVSPERPK